MRSNAVTVLWRRVAGELDAETLRASRYWYENRARLDESQPIPARPAIAENLLDALNVLQDK